MGEGGDEKGAGEEVEAWVEEVPGASQVQVGHSDGLPKFCSSDTGTAEDTSATEGLRSKLCLGEQVWGGEEVEGGPLPGCLVFSAKHQ